MTGNLARRAALISALTLLFAGLFVPQAGAVPAFARKYKVVCSECHSAWPLLNATGRKFKENGYKFKSTDDPGSVLSDLLQFDKAFPGSAVIKSRPYDKKEGGDRKNRALHEVEIMAAGAVNKNISGFIEFEAEDEDKFETSASGWLTYHAAPFFNVTFGYGDVFLTDPYDTLNAKRQLTRGRNKVIDNAFGGADADAAFRKNRQIVAISGRILDRVFYSATYSGVPGDFEGEDASNLSGRVMVDVLPEVMIGGFAFDGECQAGTIIVDEGVEEEVCAVKRDFSRIGIDAQVEVADAIFHGAYVHGRDDINAVDVDIIDTPLPRESNDAWYIEGIYVFRRPNGEGPWIVPSIRIDGFEKNDGTQDFTAITTNLSFYLFENVKIFGEWYKEVNVPTGFQKGGRFTIQAAVGF